MITKSAKVDLQGDYGNADGSGIGTAFLHDLPTDEDAILQGRITDFFDELRTGGLIAAPLRSVEITCKEIFSTGKPGTGVNIDRILTLAYTQDNIRHPRKLTIQGISKTCPYISNESAGDRLNDVGVDTLSNWLADVTGDVSSRVVRGVFTTRK